MTFERNASPFGMGRSRDAQDFANRACRNLLPWIKDHYHIYVTTRTPADPFTPMGLYNYHLRGDYYLGLTKNDPTLDNVGLNSDAATPRLVNIAETARAFDSGIAESSGMVIPIGERPMFPGAPSYGLLGASEPAAPIEPAHFFTREIANGSILTEFLFAEQATMTYKLLPYMDNFHQGVRDFLVNEALHFIENTDRLRNRRAGDPRNPTNFNETHNVHHAVCPWPGIGAQLDAVGLTFTPNGLGQIRINGANDVDLRVATVGAITFTDLFNAANVLPKPTFVLPIYYALAAHQEYIQLIQPNLEAGMSDMLDEVFDGLFREALRQSYMIGGHFYFDPVAGAYNLDNATNFRVRDYDGIPTSVQNDGANRDNIRTGIRNFFNHYFNQIDALFPMGSIVRLNTEEIVGVARSARIEAFNNQTGPVADRLNAAEFAAHVTPTAALPDNNLFMVTGRGPDRGRNRNRYQTFNLISVNNLGVPRISVNGTTVTVRNIRERWTDANNTPGLVLFRTPDQGANNQQAHAPINIVGRLLLSVSYSIFNAGAYYSTRRDMRRLTSDDAPGHYEPLNEALREAAAVSHGRRAHERGHRFGVIDLYAEQRTDLVFDYLAAMYDSLQGKYRDDFVQFFTGDFPNNELNYYTSAVSNYINNTVRPEDANRDPVLVGERLATREPQGLLPATGGRRRQAQLQYYRTADPELIYYQLDSPLLREVLRQLTTRFYTWYVELAESLDRGRRNLMRAGNETSDDPDTRRLMTPRASRGRGFADPGTDTQRIRPTKTILESLWPLLTTRAKTAVESGEVPAHQMMRRIATAVANHRTNTSQAILAVPITTSFVDFGKLLRSPGQYALPPSMESSDVEAFMGYLQSTYYNDYGLIGFLAAEIEDARTTLYTQDQLISQFKKQYASFRNTQALNRFTFPATATVVTEFRRLIATDADARATASAAEIMTTAEPPAPTEQPAVEPPLSPRFRRPSV